MNLALWDGDRQVIRISYSTTITHLYGLEIESPVDNKTDKVRETYFFNNIPGKIVSVKQVLQTAAGILSKHSKQYQQLTH